MQSVVYLGHQSWLVNVDGTQILVDPVLTRSFGYSNRLRFEIFPSRSIDIDKMPTIDAVVITNEHLDHFHPPSLRLISKDVPVFMPELIPSVCVREVTECGLRVKLLRHGRSARVKNAIIKLYQGSLSIPVWESRTASLCIEPVTGEGGIFIQSDTIVEDNEVTRNCKPNVFITTHNGQIAPEGYLGAWDNLLPIASDRPLETTGIELLQEILCHNSQLFPNVQWILFSGGSYRQRPIKHGPFLWSDFKELEEIANSLRLSGPRAVGLVPGEKAEFSSRLNRYTVDWIETIDKNTISAETTQKFSTFTDLPAIFDNVITPEQQDLMVNEFQAMAPLLLISPLGHHLVNTNYYLDDPVGPYRFAIYLRGYHMGQSDAVLALNINRAKFEWVDLTFKEALYHIPFGIDVNASDILAVCEGRIHIWELATSRMRQWYLSNKWESPVAFLYSYFSEQLRPDLAKKLYDNLRVEHIE